ncbi:unnamed protein product [Parnassius apollo]|uniref:(apollo) hypothetical protein n=1 Tax=Parnassius apollo TaxID=110799 RepID=A0A8S3XUN3_PARAO|nr:unnamed protein product [Parnassius apollo]
MLFLHSFCPTHATCSTSGGCRWLSREDPVDTRPSGGDDGCGGLLGDREAPRARLAAHMLPRSAPGRAPATPRHYYSSFNIIIL